MRGGGVHFKVHQRPDAYLSFRKSKAYSTFWIALERNQHWRETNTGEKPAGSFLALP